MNLLNEIDNILNEENNNIQNLKSILKRIQSLQNQKKELKDILWLSGLQILAVSCFIDGVDNVKINRVKSLIH